jgi:putative transposase
MMILAHKIALNPNLRQQEYFRRACGTARFAYNWALDVWCKQYANGEKPSANKLKALWNKIRRTEFPWSFDVTKCAGSQAIINLGRAFENFFKKRARFPKFKKRGQHDSFALWNDQFTVNGRMLRIPKLGWVRMHETLRFTGKILSAVVSCTADRWFISINVETKDILYPSENQAGEVGIDLGVKSLAVLSTGEVIEGPKASRKFIRKLQWLGRLLSRKVKFSANWKKTKTKLARIYARIVNIKRDALHKLTTRLAQDFKAIGIEDLNVRGMVKNHYLARSVSDQAFFEFRRQLTYKCEMTGAELVIHDPWYASSKMCSVCGLVRDKLPLSVRKWSCECGAVHDRDFNAAINLKPTTAGLAGSNACGLEGSGPGTSTRTKPTRLKQELSTTHLCVEEKEQIAVV